MAFDRNAYLSETDSMLGAPAGYSAAQIKVESNWNPNAVSPAGAVGLAQVMPTTQRSLEKRWGAPIDVRDEQTALRVQRELMLENKKRFGNLDDAARAYNGGWTPASWTNAETSAYPGKIRTAMGGGAVTPATTQGADLSGFLNDPNLAPIIAQARADKFSDAEIFSRLTSAMKSGNMPAPEQSAPQIDPKQLGSAIAQMATGKMTDAQIVGKLAQDPTLGPIVRQAAKDNFSDSEIVARLGGEAFAPIAAARAERGGQGTIARTIEGTKAGGTNLVAGVQQIGARISGDDARLKELQAEQVAREADPRYQALMDTTAGAVGEALPTVVPAVAAGFATGGLGVPAIIGTEAALGAAQGALRPTTADGQFGQNIALGGALGAAGGAGGAAVANAPRLIGRGAQSYMRGGESVADLTARQAALKAEGIEATPAMLSSRGAAMSKALEDNVPFAGAFGASKGANVADEGLMRAITRRAGHEADAIDSNFVKAAEGNIGKLYDDALDGVRVPLSTTQRNQVISSLERQIADAPADVKQIVAAKYASELASLKSGGSQIDAKTLQAIRSEIGGDGASATLTPLQKKAYGQIYGDLSDALRKGLTPQQLGKFEQANSAYQHLMPVKSMVSKSGDTGTVTLSQIEQAIKSGSLKNDFIHGNAPYQDLLSAMGGAKKGGNGGAAKVANSAVAGITLGTGALGIPVAANAAVRALNNPNLTNLLLGLNPAQKSRVLNAILGGSAGAGAGAAQAIGNVAPALTEEQMAQLAGALGGNAPGAGRQPTGKDLAAALKYRT